MEGLELSAMLRMPRILGPSPLYLRVLLPAAVSARMPLYSDFQKLYMMRHVDITHLEEPDPGSETKASLA
jgi:hypothetical protein